MHLPYAPVGSRLSARFCAYTDTAGTRFHEGTGKNDRAAAILIGPYILTNISRR